MDILNIDELDIDDDTMLAPTQPAVWERPPVRMSHSSRGLLHGCERKYYLTRYKKLDSLADIAPPDTDKNNEHLDFGSALGIGIQALIITNGDLEAAIWTAIRAFNFANETPTKNIRSLVFGLMSFDQQWNYNEWEVAIYDNNPAAELSFKIILDPVTGDYTCGFMDLVLRSVSTGLYTVLEVKSTGVKHENIAPMYSNSDQGVGYSIVLDHIAGEHSTFHVLYAVMQLKSNNIVPTWHFLPFLKTKKDRLEFLLAQQLDYEYLKQLEAIDFWPMRGNHCIAFGKVCHLYGTCQLETLKELPFQPAKAEHDWTFTYNVQELIEEQMK